MSDMATSLFTRILVGVDGSDGSTRALQWAAAVVENTDAKVIAAHILTYDREFGRDLTLDTMRPWRPSSNMTCAQNGPNRSASRTSRITACCSKPSRAPPDSRSWQTEKAGISSSSDQTVTAASRDECSAACRDRLAHHARCPLVVVPSTWSPRKLRSAQTVS